MKRDERNLVVLWVVLSVIGWVIVAAANIFPAAYSEEAHVVDNAFILLTALGVPVFAFVIAVLGYSLFRFRSPGAQEDGPNDWGHPRTIAAWLVLTGTLAAFVIIHPGFTGLAEVRGDAGQDIVIDITGQRWSWKATYPNGAEVWSFDSDLVLPVDSRIRFDVTVPSNDVVHSFWIPAFRVKIDAVPGRVTQLHVTPTQTGSYDQDDTLRVQCAELCGVEHTDMAMPVRVVEADEYEVWLAGLVEEGS